MKQKMAPVLLKIFAFTAFMFAVYFFIFLNPAKKIPSALLDTKKTLTNQYANLLQNRLALKQIIRLNPQGARYIYARERSYALLAETKDKGKQQISDSALPDFPTTTNEEINNVFDILKDEYPKLVSEYKRILDLQPDFIDEQKSFDQRTDKIFEYFPERDIASLDTQKDKDKIIERSEAAIKGLETIKNDWPNLEKPIETVQLDYQRIISSISSGNHSETNDSIQNLVSNFKLLKSETHKEKVKLLTSEENIQSLTDISNLIIDYKKLIDKINSSQETLKTSIF